MNAVLHPQTGEKIFLPFRMSAFAPLNIAVVAGCGAPRGGRAAARADAFAPE